MRVRTLDDLIRLYLQHQGARAREGQISEETPAQYARQLRRAESIAHLPIARLTAPRLHEWRLSLGDGRPVARRAAAVRLRQVLHWARDAGHLSADLAGLVHLPRCRSKRGRPLDEAALGRLVRACRAERARRGGGDRLSAARATAVADLVELQALTGARSGELRRARPEALGPDGRTLSVVGKRGPRRLALSFPARAIVERRVEPVLGAHLFLFPGAGEGPLSNAACYAGFKRLAGEDGRGRHPNDLRHTAVTLVRRRGGTWRDAADLAGHQLESTTMLVYDHSEDTPGAHSAAGLLADLIEGVARG